MYAIDFIFDNQRASDFDLIICSFDNNDEVVSGGEIEHEVVKAPNTDKFEDYGGQLSNVLTWKISVAKNPCIYHGKDMYFNQYTASEVMKWLVRKRGFRWLHFDQDDYDDIWYKVYINALPHQIGGKTIGFDLTITANCAYGFSGLITRWETANSTSPAIFSLNCDIDDYILPYIEVQGTGNFILYNKNDNRQNNINNKETVLKNINQKIIMDTEYGLINGILSPTDFNYYFLRLVDGVNTIVTDSQENISLKIQYREPRRVAV